MIKEDFIKWAMSINLTSYSATTQALLKSSYMAGIQNGIVEALNVEGSEETLTELFDVVNAQSQKIHDEIERLRFS